jgi:hypothetical protein
MGEQLQPKNKIGELCNLDTVGLPIINLQDLGRLFKIKVSTIRMVQDLPFTSKEDQNLHLQAFVQLYQTFNADGVTQDQMRVLMVKFCQPSHEFTFGVGMSFISYPLVLTPLI